MIKENVFINKIDLENLGDDDLKDLTSLHYNVLSYFLRNKTRTEIIEYKKVLDFLLNEDKNIYKVSDFDIDIVNDVLSRLSSLSRDENVNDILSKIKELFDIYYVSSLDNNNISVGVDTSEKDEIIADLTNQVNNLSTQLQDSLNSINLLENTVSEKEILISDLQSQVLNLNDIINNSSSSSSFDYDVFSILDSDRIKFATSLTNDFIKNNSDFENINNFKVAFLIIDNENLIDINTATSYFVLNYVRTDSSGSSVDFNFGAGLKSFSIKKLEDSSNIFNSIKNNLFISSSINYYLIEIDLLELFDEGYLRSNIASMSLKGLYS
jgi:hypothetical protein